MQKPSYLSEPQVNYLSQILQEIKDGSLLIPRFQRPYVWTVEQRLELLDSVRDEMPIGSILVWRTSLQGLATLERVGGIKTSLGKRHTELRTYVLDGHQRLATLFGALFKRAEDEPLLDIDNEVSWNFVYDLRDDVFRLLTTNKPGAHTIPLNILLDSIALLKFQRQLIADSSKDGDLVDKTDRIASAFRNYKIAVVPIVTDELEIATTSFQRVNSGGTQMSAVHMVAALTWRRDFDLLDEFATLQERLDVFGWGGIDDKYILAICRVLLQLDIYKSAPRKTSEAIRQNVDVLEKVFEHIKRAAKFLRDNCNIHSYRQLPYGFQIVMLSEFMHQTARPNTRQLEWLRRWFWKSTYTAYFSGASDVDLRKTLGYIQYGARDKSFDPNRNTKVPTLPKRFDFRSARMQALIVRMLELQPLTPDGKSRLTFEDGVTAEEVCHILEGGTGLTALAGPENRCLMHPRSIGEFRRVLRSARHHSNEDFFESHGISEYALEALHLGDEAGFLAERRRGLKAIERKFIEGLSLKYNA